MHASISVSDIAAVMKPVLGACQQRGSIPILSCVLIEAEGESLSLTCSDLDMFVSARIEAVVTSPGSTAVNAKRLAAMLTGDRAELILSDGMLDVALRSGRVRLPALAAEDFPAARVDDGDWIDVPFGVPALSSVMDFSSREETRYYLNGACLSRDHLVATTGHTLLARKFKGDLGCIIPASSLKVLNAMSDAEISISANWWRARSGDLIATGKLIDGTFPDWQRVVPSIETTATVDADVLAEALSWVAKVSSERHGGVKLSVEDGRLTLTCLDTTGAMAEQHIPIDGHLPDVGANITYLLTACRVFAGQVVAIGCEGASDPILITHDDARAVVMPMRI